MLKRCLSVCAAALVGSALHGAPLTEAQVTKIINFVHVVDPAHGVHSAVINEKIHDEIELKTGVKSRSELLFQDNTLTRVGPETSFSFKAGTRDLQLNQGSMLLQVPKGLGGAKIRTAAITAAITGTTVMMKYTPRKEVKVLVLEGRLRLSVNALPGDSVLLTPGKMVVMPPGAKHIPQPVTVDLRRVMQSSSLVKMNGKGKGNLPSADLIENEIAKQDQELHSGRLTQSDFVNGYQSSVTGLRGLRATVEHPADDSDLGFSHHR